MGLVWMDGRAGWFFFRWLDNSLSKPTTEFQNETLDKESTFPQSRLTSLHTDSERCELFHEQRTVVEMKAEKKNKPWTNQPSRTFIKDFQWIYQVQEPNPKSQFGLLSPETERRKRRRKKRRGEGKKILDKVNKAICSADQSQDCFSACGPMQPEPSIG